MGITKSYLFTRKQNEMAAMYPNDFITKERCPFFPTNAIKLHENFPDPAKATVTETEIMEQFAQVRQTIKTYCRGFVNEYIV